MPKDSLIAVNRQRQQLKERRERCKDWFEQVTERHKEQAKELAEREHAIIHQLDRKKLKLAETVLEIYRIERFSGEGDDHTALGHIRDALLNPTSGRNLLHDWIGVKNYAHWSHQWCSHSYGMGPAHGSTVWSVGLSKKVRDRNPSGTLTDRELEAALYYLACVSARRWPVAAEGAA